MPHNSRSKLRFKKVIMCNVIIDSDFRQNVIVISTSGKHGHGPGGPRCFSRASQAKRSADRNPCGAARSALSCFTCRDRDRDLALKRNIHYIFGIRDLSEFTVQWNEKSALGY